MDKRGNIPTSDAIWISKGSTGGASAAAADSYSVSPKRWPHFVRSMSVNSDASSSVSTYSTSPPMSPAMLGSSLGTESSFPYHQKANNSGGVGRRRTMTIGSESMDESSYYSNSNTAGPMFRRSNSISSGGGSYHQEQLFGGVFKRSMDHLFNATKVNTSLATVPIQKSVPKVKKLAEMPSPFGRQKNDRSNNMTDRVVSLLCENAIR